MNEHDFIIAIKETKSISDICSDLKIDYSNVINGTSSKENIKKVYDKLKIEILKMYSLLKIMEEK